MTESNPTTDDLRYRLMEELGSGGMGRVLKAEDTLFGGFVAIKLIRRSSVVDDDFLLKGLVKEARLQAKLSSAQKPHPNIVFISNLLSLRGTDIGLVMEYVDGTTLARKMGPRNTRRAVALPQFFDYGLQTCAGLQFAHERGVIHRDIKPANLMITTDGVVKIVDWGVAKNVEAAGTATTYTGTLYYMAPEVLRLQRMSRQEKEHSPGVALRADIYSLGATMFQMLTTEYPFEYENAIEVGVTDAQYRTLTGFAKPSLAEVVLKALAKRPDDRYQSAQELQDALRNWQSTYLFAGDLAAAKAEEAAGNDSEAKFQELLLNYAFNADAHHEVALFYIRRCREDKAIEVLSKGIELAPENGLLHEARGRLYAKRNSQLAIGDLQKALRLLPSAEAQERRGKMLQTMLNRVKGNKMGGG